jgi:sodium/proline symporter
MAGGYLAVCATDFIQGTLMFLALIVTTVIMMIVLGGPAAAASKISVFGAQFLNPFVDDGTGFGVMSIISALGWGLGYFGMPHILVRFMGISSNKDIPLSRRIAMVWVTIAFIGALAIGALAKVYLNTPLPEGAQETVVIASIKQMYPAFIGGIFLCAILAAAMSTADSQLLVAASAFCEDFVTTILKRKLSEKQMVVVSRLTVLAIALIAFLMSLNEHSTIFSLVSYAWAGFGATFGPLILLALFWKGCTNKGAIAGIITGGITVILWHNLHGGIFDLYEIIPGFLVCLLFAVVVSLCDKNKNPEMLAEFDAYQAELKA